MLNFRQGDRVESPHLGKGTFQRKRNARMALVLWDQCPSKEYNGAANPSLEPLDTLLPEKLSEEAGYAERFSYAHRISLYLDKRYPRYCMSNDIIHELKLPSAELAEDILCQLVIGGAATMRNISNVAYFQWVREKDMEVTHRVG